MDPQKVKDRIARGDGSVAPHHVSADSKIANPAPVPGDGKIEPHDRETVVTTAITLEKLICPDCGKPTARAEFPDHYEAWIKCSSCGFFMGMSNEDWHKMENSRNLSEKIKKMAIQKKMVHPRPLASQAV